jgi:hypothetical protein
MRVHRVIAGLAALAVLAAAPASAAVPAGSTVLVSRPAADPLPAGAVNDSEIGGHGAVSETGQFVVFDSQPRTARFRVKRP